MTTHKKAKGVPLHHPSHSWTKWAFGAFGLGGLLVMIAVVWLGLRLREQGTPIPTPSLMPTPGTVTTLTRSADDMVMVFVPAGNFTMGANAEESYTECEKYQPSSNFAMCQRGTSEEPVHTVYLDAYWIDRSEVTNAMYARCVQAEACAFPESSGSSTRDSYYGNPPFDNYPVIYVTWDDAAAYCEWAGARLPTEAEWEKAARGTDGRMYPWGDTSPSCELANIWREEIGACSGDTSAVGAYPNGISPYGTWDMAGNVWEWVADWYGGDYYGQSPSSNPGGPASGAYHILRGGSWHNARFMARAASRNPAGSEETGYATGFRCASSASP